jgi:hypothetical protein
MPDYSSTANISAKSANSSGRIISFSSRAASKPREQFPGLSLCVLAYRAINFLRGVQKTSAGQSTPFAPQARASLSPLLRMLSLLTSPLLAPRALWHRLLSVDTYPPVMT